MAPVPHDRVTGYSFPSMAPLNPKDRTSSLSYVTDPEYARAGSACSTRTKTPAGLTALPQSDFFRLRVQDPLNCAGSVRHPASKPTTNRLAQLTRSFFIEVTHRLSACKRWILFAQVDTDQERREDDNHDGQCACGSKKINNDGVLECPVAPVMCENAGMHINDLLVLPSENALD